MANGMTEGRPGKRSREQRIRELLRRAKTEANSKFSATGRRRKQRPITMPGAYGESAPQKQEG